MLAQSQADLKMAYLKLRQLLQTDEIFLVSPAEINLTPSTQRAITTAPTYQLIQSYSEQVNKSLSLSKHQFFPDLQASYFQGTNDGPAAKMYRGVQAGIAVPLLWSTKNRIKLSQTSTKSIELQEENYLLTYNNKALQLKELLLKYEISIDLYTQTLQKLSESILQTAITSYEVGEMSYPTLITSMEEAKQIEMNYLENLRNYNNTAIQIQFLN